MKKYKYLRLSKTKKLRYLSNYLKKKLYIIFLPGFMSDIEGEKPTTFRRYAIKKKLGFLTLEYSGHGKSSGDFTKGVGLNQKQIEKSINKTSSKSLEIEVKPFEIHTHFSIFLLVETNVNNLFTKDIHTSEQKKSLRKSKRIPISDT